ncbi:unnamed protein product [Caenorhabditis bovis]|uniref:Uncharacterized protein n=1 Tax=Caenorhabditis bovis TaxID=2654633 RepID=A0A8S1EMM3_9PELO|nr:unnamed protein product [Caenorhabditis bovis]
MFSKGFSTIGFACLILATSAQIQDNDEKRSGARSFQFEKRGGARGFIPAEYEEKRGGARGFNPVNYDEKRGGARGFIPINVEEKRGGARGFIPINVEEKRGGARGFLSLTNEEKRGGGHEFVPFNTQINEDMSSSGLFGEKRGGARFLHGNTRDEDWVIKPISDFEGYRLGLY